MTELRPDPDAAGAGFTRPANGAIFDAAQTYKDEYKRGDRQGQKVYLWQPDPSHWIAPDDYKKLRKRPATGGAQSAKEKIFHAGKVLSEQEAEEYYEPLMEAIKDDFHYLDEALWLRCPQIKDEDIWGNVDEDECQALAKLLLKKARRSPIAASVVRTAIDTHDYLVVGALFVPRIHQTVQALRQAPKRERKSLKLVRSME